MTIDEKLDAITTLVDEAVKKAREVDETAREGQENETFLMNLVGSSKQGRVTVGGHFSIGDVVLAIVKLVDIVPENERVNLLKAVIATLEANDIIGVKMVQVKPNGFPGFTPDPNNIVN